MIIRCEACRTVFDVRDDLIKPEGTKVRCASCKAVFVARPSGPMARKSSRLYPPAGAKTTPKKLPRPAPPPKGPAAPDEEGPEATVAIGSDGRFPGEEEDEGPEATVALPAGEAPSARRLMETTIAPPRPVPPAERAKPAPEARARKRYVPFKRKLIYFALFIIIFIAAIVIPIEAVRPWKELDQLIEEGRNLIAGTYAAFDRTELARMNRFALYTIQNRPEEMAENRPYYFLAFNMLLMEGELLAEEEILARIEYPGEFGGSFAYPKLVYARTYWQARFTADPGIYEIFRKYKFILIAAKKNAAAAGFDLSAMYIMLDTGKREGFFENNIAYVLDSVPWWSDVIPSSSGEPYEITDNAFWRADALAGRPGYGNNPVFDPRKWYPMPRFDEDEWGAWFSVWLTTAVDGVYNIVNIDFDASRVKRLMAIVAATVGAVILLMTLLAVVIANLLSRRVTRPITELTRGAAEVERGNYEYVVPVLKEDEFGELTRQFNMMTRGQRERINLLETLKKFLSEELALKAAESGIVIGGQKTHCTVMFTDFAGFSTITRQMAASEAVNILNAYFDGLVPVVKKYGGFPDKYIGDAIVALFGAPVNLPDHAERAVSCAIEMQRTIRAINEQRRRSGKTVFEMRVGLNSGEVIVGAIGCDTKLEYTSIGETTNLANRMEAICKIGHVMIAEGTYLQIRDIFFPGVHISETPERVQVKGYPRPVETYGIYVDDLVIEKNIEADRHAFYTYASTDHRLKQRPEDVQGRTFARVARFS